MHLSAATSSLAPGSKAADFNLYPDLWLLGAVG